MNDSIKKILGLEPRSHGDDYSPHDYDITIGYNLAVDIISKEIEQAIKDGRITINE